MKKVICINNKPMKMAANRHLNLLEEGGIYTIEKISLNDGGYYLKEISINEPYHNLRFIPLSDIDETESAEQRTSTVPIYGF